MSNLNVQKIILLAVLIAFSSVLSYFDSSLCNFITGGIIPYKLGLANVVIMVILYNYDSKSSYLAVILKSIIGGFILGQGYTTFVFSLLGGLLSLTGMICFKKILFKPNFSPFIGLIGGFLHPIGQIIGVMLIYGFKEFFEASLMMLPIWLISGVITGLIVGLTAQKINVLISDLIN